MGDAAEQLDLWEEWPDAPQIVDRVAKQSFVRTGKLMGKEPQRCRAICLDIIFGRHTGLISDRKIAAKHRVSRNSFDRIVAIMESRGELEPLSKLVNGMLDINALLMGQRINEGLLEGTIHPGQLPIPWLAALDKRAQRDAGMVQGTERTAEAVTLERLMAARALVLAASDSKADAHAMQRAQSQASDCLSGEPATGPATGTKALPAPNGITIDLPRPTANPAIAGGGVADPPSDQCARGDGFENSDP